MNPQHAFFKPPWPSKVLFTAIVSTQVLAVLMCGFGWLVPEIPWRLIGLVWIYLILWTFVLDAAKLCFYRLIENRAQHYRKYLNTVNQPLRPHVGA